MGRHWIQVRLMEGAVERSRVDSDDYAQAAIERLYLEHATKHFARPSAAECAFALARGAGNARGWRGAGM